MELENLEKYDTLNLNNINISEDEQKNFLETTLGKAINIVPIGAVTIVLLFMISLLYCIVATFAKRHYIKKYNEWI